MAFIFICDRRIAWLDNDAAVMQVSRSGLSRSDRDRTALRLVRPFDHARFFSYRFKCDLFFHIVTEKQFVRPRIEIRDV